MDNPTSPRRMREFWDAAAATFDNEPDHGLHDPRTRAAWAALLASFIPPQPSRVLDIGCGTGSLSLLLASMGHAVTGVDLSPLMLEQAMRKANAAGARLLLSAMDAAYPAIAPARFDVVLCRHVLWALPQPDEVARRWAALLKPGGRLVLVEGFWHTGAGLKSADALALLPDDLIDTRMQSLTANDALWGGAVTDERYVITAKRPG